MTVIKKASISGLDCDCKLELITHNVIFAIAQEIGLVGSALPEGMEATDLEAELGVGVICINEPFTTSDGEALSRYDGRAIALLDSEENVLLLD